MEAQAYLREANQTSPKSSLRLVMQENLLCKRLEAPAWPGQTYISSSDLQLYLTILLNSVKNTGNYSRIQ